MNEIIIDTVLDILKIIPFLFVAFFIIEYTEHKLNHESTKIVKKAGKLGPMIGSLLGAIPQCGFSVLATNLYVTRIITLGTLISIYLSTSDEMLLIMLAEKANIKDILSLVIIKIIIGMVCGFLIDLFIKNKDEKKYDICKQDQCDCEHSPIKSAIKHTLKTSTFIIIITFILNACFHYIGEDNVKNIFNQNNLLTPFISSLVGLIPNCGASVIITELYLNNVLTFAQSIAGLLTNSGVALLILFKSNNNIKENMKIIGILYVVGVTTGLILELFAL